MTCWRTGSTRRRFTSSGYAPSSSNASCAARPRKFRVLTRRACCVTSASSGPDRTEGAAMAFQEVKLYQVGTFVVGNRLLDPEQRSVQARMDRSNSITSGHRACQGCGEVLGARYVLDAAMRATGGNLVAANSTG